MKNNNEKNVIETNRADTDRATGQPESGVQPSTISRRQTLKTALAGGAALSAGAMPAKWSAPVVNSVVLPAHGATSAVADSWFVTFPQGLDLVALQSRFQQSDGKPVQGGSQTLARSIADTLIPVAHADNYRGHTICVEPIDNVGGIAVRWLDFITEDDEDHTTGFVLFEGTGVLGTFIDLASDCEITKDFVYSVKLTEQPDGTLKIVVIGNEGGEIEGIIPRGLCSITEGECPQRLR